MNVEDSLQEANSSFLFFGFIIVRFKLKCWQQTLLEFFEGLHRDDKSWNILLLIFDFIISIVHVPQHFKGTWTHRIA
jgi:hypothetical protein